MQARGARRIAYLVLAALVFVTSCRAWSHAAPYPDPVPEPAITAPVMDLS